jgi:hypothetical protein
MHAVIMGEGLVDLVVVLAEARAPEPSSIAPTGAVVKSRGACAS